MSDEDCRNGLSDDLLFQSDIKKSAIHWEVVQIGTQRWVFEDSTNGLRSNLQVVKILQKKKNGIAKPISIW